MNISDWIALAGVIVGIIGIIVGYIGGRELREANNIKIKIRDVEAKIEKIEISNSQIAKTINNNGLGIADTEFIANRIVKEKTKNKPDFISSDESPENIELGDIWISGK